MASRRNSAKKGQKSRGSIQMAVRSEDEAVFIKIEDPEEEKKESKSENRNQRTGLFSLGRVMCGKIVAIIADILNWICFCGFIKRLLCRIFKFLYEALRDNIEELEDLSPMVDNLL
jgi:hypothetical protein